MAATYDGIVGSNFHSSCGIRSGGPAPDLIVKVDIDLILSFRRAAKFSYQ